MGQDNETLQTRITKAVANAVIEAGRPYPGAKDIYLDSDAVLFGMCDAIASTAAAFGQMPEDPEAGAKLMESMEERIVARLRLIADLIRTGRFPSDPEDRPKPRLVK